MEQEQPRPANPTDSRDHPDHAVATVNRDTDGEALGVMLFFGVDDLEDLGIDTDTAQEVVYWVENGEPRLAPKHGAIDDE